MQLVKRDVLAALRLALEDELSRFRKRALDAAEAATHEENRPEGDKDMRSTEASYVARGQAERVRELETALARLSGIVPRSFADGEAIAVGALVELEHAGQRSTVFLVPAGGGVRVGDVQSLATASPLGVALLGLTAGDEAEVHAAGGVRTYEVLRVA